MLSPQLRFAYTLGDPPAFKCRFPGCSRVLNYATALRLHEQLHVDTELCSLSDSGVLLDEGSGNKSANEMMGSLEHLEGSTTAVEERVGPTGLGTGELL
jgi:hypothetical protein